MAGVPNRRSIFSRASVTLPPNIKPVSSKQRRATLQPTFKTEPEPLTNEILGINKSSFGRRNSLEYLIEDAKSLHKKLFALSLDLDLDQVGLDEPPVKTKPTSTPRRKTSNNKRPVIKCM